MELADSADVGAGGMSIADMTFNALQILKSITSWLRKIVLLWTSPVNRLASQIWDKFMNFIISRFPTQAERIFASLLEQMDPTQLDSMIEFYTQAIPQISRGNTMALQWLNTLGVLHLTRFERRGELEDLNTALLHLARVFIFSPDEYSGQLTLLNNIAAVHRAKYEHMRQNEDLDEAIGLMIKAKELAEADGERMSVLGNLGVLYHLRFEALGQMDDLGLAIQHLGPALSLTHNPPDRSRILNNLGLTAEKLFHRTGSLEVLDMAITCLKDAALLLQEGSAHLPLLYNNLGMAYHTRYERLQDTDDLKSAIKYLSDAVSSSDSLNPDNLACYSHLGLAYQTQFERSGNIMDLDSALAYLNQAASQTPDDHPAKGLRLNNLGFVFGIRSHVRNDLTDLNAAIECLSQAALLLSNEHTDFTGLLSNLGDAYCIRYARLQYHPDLVSGIECLNKTVELTSDEHPNWPNRLISLGDAYISLFQQSKDQSHKYTGLEFIKQAAHSRVGSPQKKLRAAHKWAIISLEYEPSSALDGYRRVMELIPEVVWLGETTAKRYEDIPSISYIISQAVVTALESQKPDIALEWLESGRSIVWNQTLQLRTPLDHLATIDRSLAEQLKQVSQELERISSSRGVSREVDLAQATAEEAAQQHRRVAEKRDRLIEQIRNLPGNADFLQAKQASALVSASRTGAVVVIHVHSTGCHALIIRHHSTAVSILPLPKFTHKNAMDAGRRLAHSLRSYGLASRGVTKDIPKGDNVFSEILSMLWTDLAQLVLDYLGYMSAPTDELPHITWLTTGLLSFLPLHAAGDYSKPNRSLSDYAISSYTPTLSALLTSSVNPPSLLGVLLVGQVQTQGFSSIKFTPLELDRISALASSQRVTRLEGESATTGAVLAALDNHSWFHAACHAKQHILEPASSAFYLHDGPLDLRKISQLNLANADLAFLSACETAVGDEILSEESIHLAAGMLTAGFKRVIATMWGVEDEDAPFVAENFYAYMLDEGKPNNRKAAKALHYAVRSLREKVGVKEFHRWASYIHIGL